MDKVATASINTFGNSPKADASPSEDPIFVLTASQLRQIVTDAITKAIQPLQHEVMELKATVASQQEEIADMRLKVASLESLQESEISRVCVDIAQDRRRLSALEKVEPQPLQKDRGEILRALIAANGGKMLAKDARQKMRLAPWTFSKLLDTMVDYIESRPYRLKGNQKLLILKSNLIARNMQQD